MHWSISAGSHLQEDQRIYKANLATMMPRGVEYLLREELLFIFAISLIMRPHLGEVFWSNLRVTYRNFFRVHLNIMVLRDLVVGSMQMIR